MKFRHEFEVQSPVETVAQFHSRSSSLVAITPPPILVRLHQAPDEMGEGDEMTFTMWTGPIPIRWQARVGDVSPTGFADRQIMGPFEEWTHCHTFVSLDESRTLVVDEVEATLKRHLWWGLLGLGMWLGLPLLFAYRAWKTRRLLEGHNSDQGDRYAG